MERRLVAILVADVVGYSRLMEADEAGTLTALKNRRSRLLEPLVAGHGGRIIKFMGDGVLVEFKSAVSAVGCAVALQRDMAAANAEPQAAQIALRIGINLGDVIVEGSDLYGDGINIAARLQALARPGGICISDVVHRQVRGKIDQRFDDLGEQQLKNMAEPIRLFHTSDVQAAGASHAVPERSDAAPKRGQGRASIAILPFDNMSDDPDQGYFSDGITEDIITELSRFKTLFVVARNSSFALRGKSLDMKDLGRQLGVQYAVEGSVRKAGRRIRITVQLIETETGSHMWAERYDRDLEDIFAIQDEISRTIASTLGGRIEIAEKKQARRLSPDGLRAYDLCLQAAAAKDRNTKADYQRARELLNRALELEPDFAPAHHHLSLASFIEWMAYWADDRDKAFADSLAAGRRALALDDSNASLHAHMGMLLMHCGEYEQGEAHFKKAMILNVNDSRAMTLYGYFLTATGRIDEALTMFEKAAQFNPFQPEWTSWLKGIALFTAHRYGEAVGVFETINAPLNEVRGWLAASYAHAGDLGRARTHLEHFLRTAEAEMTHVPGRRLEAWKPYWDGAIPYRDAANALHLLAGLRKAGLPD